MTIDDFGQASGESSQNQTLPPQDRQQIALSPADRCLQLNAVDRTTRKRCFADCRGNCAPTRVQDD